MLGRAEKSTGRYQLSRDFIGSFACAKQLLRRAGRSSQLLTHILPPTMHPLSLYWWIFTLACSSQVLAENNGHTTQSSGPTSSASRSRQSVSVSMTTLANSSVVSQNVMVPRNGTAAANGTNVTKPSLPPLPKGFSNPLDTGGTMLGVRQRDCRLYSIINLAHPGESR